MDGAEGEEGVRDIESAQTGRDRRECGDRREWRVEASSGDQCKVGGTLGISAWRLPIDIYKILKVRIIGRYSNATFSARSYIR